MRIDKLGSRFLRVITPDGKTRYFSSGHGSASLRLFWIFRNFATLNDRLLTVHQRELIRQIYRTGEVRKEWMDPTNILGTLEVSSLASTEDWTVPGRRVIQLAIVPPPILKPKPVRSLRSFVLSANGLAAVLLFFVVLFANRNARLQSESSSSNADKLAKSLPTSPLKQRKDSTQVTSAKPADEEAPSEAPIVKPTVSIGVGTPPTNDRSNASAEDDAPGDDPNAEAANIRPAAIQQAASYQTRSSEAPPSIPIPNRYSGSLTSLSVSSMDKLPPSGPPQTHPVLGDFSSVEQDTEVILRAIVSADGSVTKVKVLEGDSKLAREAAHAVTSWRYPPRTSTGYAESRIAFHFAPDTVSVSFLDPATRNTQR